MAAASPALKRPKVGIGQLVSIQNLRTLVQFVFVAFIAYTVAISRIVGEGGSTIVASAEAFCPFGGFEALYAFITSGGSRFVPHTHVSNVVLFVGLVVTTLLFRGAFCGWICPLGALQEWTYRLSGWLQKRVPRIGRAVKAIKARVDPRAGVSLAAPSRSLAHRLDRWARYFKYVVLLWIVWGTISYGVMVFRDVDPWAALLNLGGEAATIGIVVLIVVFVAGLFVERAWCRYACPLGAIVGIVGKISPVRIQREGETCSGCAICDRKCPVGIPVATVGDVTDAACNMCLRCVDTCPRPGALELKLVVPGVKA